MSHPFSRFSTHPLCTVNFVLCWLSFELAYVHCTAARQRRTSIHGQSVDQGLMALPFLGKVPLCTGKLSSLDSFLVQYERKVWENLDFLPSPYVIPNRKTRHCTNKSPRPPCPLSSLVGAKEPFRSDAAPKRVPSKAEINYQGGKKNTQKLLEDLATCKTQQPHRERCSVQGW